MGKFVIAPHFRSQDRAAEEKGNFRDEGLDYAFRETMPSSIVAGHQLGDKVGAYQTTRGIFRDGNLGSNDDEHSIVTLAAAA